MKTSKNTKSDTQATSANVEKLAYTRDELKAILPVSSLTIWRYEKRGLLIRVPGIRLPLYSRASVEAFLAGETSAKL